MADCPLPPGLEQFADLLRDYRADCRRAQRDCGGCGMAQVLRDYTARLATRRRLTVAPKRRAR